MAAAVENETLFFFFLCVRCENATHAQKEKKQQHIRFRGFPLNKMCCLIYVLRTYLLKYLECSGLYVARCVGITYSSARESRSR